MEFFEEYPHRFKMPLVVSSFRDSISVFIGRKVNVNQYENGHELPVDRMWEGDLEGRDCRADLRHTKDDMHAP